MTTPNSPQVLSEEEFEKTLWDAVNVLDDDGPSYNKLIAHNQALAAQATQLIHERDEALSKVEDLERELGHEREYVQGAHDRHEQLNEQVTLLQRELADEQASVAEKRGLIRDLTTALENQKQQHAALQTKYKELVKFYDTHVGTPCEEIRHREEVAALRERVSQLEEAMRVDLQERIEIAEAYRLLGVRMDKGFWVASKQALATGAEGSK